VQHDAEVNRGNSGGPLWNLSGDLVGINGMIIVREAHPLFGPVSSGVSFAIPIEQVYGHLRTLADKRKDAKSPWLGLVTETVTDTKGKPAGAKILFIDPRSPCGRDARNSSVAVGDLIVSLSVKGRRYVVRTQGDIANALMQTQAGAPVTIYYRRNGRSDRWSGKLGTLD
jgi:serine protease Do